MVNAAIISTPCRTGRSLNRAKTPISQGIGKGSACGSFAARTSRGSIVMRKLALAAALLVLVVPARAAVTPEIDPRASLGVVQQWIYNYRAKPDYAHVPAAVRVLFHSQTFKEPENAGIYLGFIAGAIGSNPAKAEQLVNSFFPVPPEDEWVVIRAIAYSGLPDWRNQIGRA